MQWLIIWLRVHSILENSLGFVSENVENVSMQKLGGGGGGHTEFSRERRQVFPMQSGCSRGKRHFFFSGDGVY